MIRCAWYAVVFWLRTVGRKRDRVTVADSRYFERRQMVKLGKSFYYVVRVRPGCIDVVAREGVA